MGALELGFGFALVLSLLATLFCPRVAHADEEAARQHFQQGVEAYDKKEYDKALAAFEAAYREKRSAGIKRSIGLTLKAQGKLVDAARAFDEGIEEGRTTLKPETRASIEYELAELSKVLATVQVKVVTGDGVEQKAVDNVVVSVDGEALPGGAHRLPIRVDPRASARYVISRIRSRPRVVLSARRRSGDRRSGRCSSRTRGRASRCRARCSG